MFNIYYIGDAVRAIEINPDVLINAMKEGRSAFKMLTGTLAGKRPFGKPWRRWEDNIRMYVKGIGISTRNRVDLTQNRGYWRALVNLRVS
jgi:hypothetical protein